MHGNHAWATELSWVLEGELLAFSVFALADLDALAEEGVGAIVSLTERFPEELIGERRFATLHLPIADMTPPEMAQIAQFVAFVNEQTKLGRAVGVHCMAGLGRTGTMIACYLVTRGRRAEDAIDEVRSARPGSIQTESQEQIVRRWEVARFGKSGLPEFM